MSITEIQIEQFDGSKVTHVIIDNGDGSFTSMAKAHYESLKEAEQLNGIVDGETL